MQQSSNNKNIEKNLKLMVISAIILIVLFIYTIYKSSSSIQGSSYYFGIGFLFVLLILSLILKLNQDKIRKYLENKKIKNTPNAFGIQLQKMTEQATQKLQEELESNIKPISSNITFKDVAGIKEIKEELEEIVDFLNNPTKYNKFGVKLPKGVLLAGAPGVGKTLIARAVAGEAKVPFFYQSGSSFVHIYVGMGAKKVRELFIQAKLNAPSIIFIDEIDAVGKVRSGHSNDEREATLNELLTQMDGFDGESGVIVIAATNKIEVLDDALLRAGRFDRRLYIGLPNIEDRKQILKLYLKDKNSKLNIEKLANETVGFSSASLSTLINEALLNMIKSNRKVLDYSDIEIAKNKLEFGKKQIKILNSKQKEILAIYQASKAFISKSKISLLDESVVKLNSIYPSYSELCENIKRYLAGFVGLEVVKKEKFAINSEDLNKAYKLADIIVNEHKMADDINNLILKIKNELKVELSSNIDEIIRLKDIMLENEVVTIEDF